MDAYYASQSSNSMPYFSGHYRQRGSGFGALAAGIGRVALPIARKFIWPTAKRIGRELISQAAPEVADVVMKKKKPQSRPSKTRLRKQHENSLEDLYTIEFVNHIQDPQKLNAQSGRENLNDESFPQNQGYREVGLIFSLE